MRREISDYTTMWYAFGETIHAGLFTRVVAARLPDHEQPLALKLPNEATPSEWMLAKLRNC